MSGPVRNLKCPACQAPISLLDQDRRVTCAYCKASLEVPAHADSFTTVLRVISTGKSAPARNSSVWASVSVGIVLFVIALGLWIRLSHRKQILTSYPQDSHHSSIQTTPSSPVADAQDPPASNTTVPPTQPSPFSSVRPLLWALPNAAWVAFAKINAEQSQLVELSGAPLTQRWVGPTVSNRQVNESTPRGSDDEHLYFVQGPRLVAVQRTSGKTAWEVPLTAEINPRCESCLDVREGIATVFTKDGILHAVSAHDGKSVWDVNLKNSLLRMYGLTQGIAFVDFRGAQMPSTLTLLDRHTGKQKTAWLGDTPNQLRLNEPIVFDEPHNAVYHLFHHSEPLSIQRWRMLPAKKQWRVSTGAPPNARSIAPEPNMILGDQEMFFATDRVVYGVQQRTGALHVVWHTEEGYLRLLGLASSILVVEHTTELINGNHEIWGIDIRTGAQRWRYTPLLATAQPAEELPATLGDNGEKWWWHLHGNQLTFVQKNPADAKWYMDTIPVETGISPGRIALSSDGATRWDHTTHLVGWHEGTLWLVHEDQLQQLDVRTGTLIQTWPAPPQ